MAKVAGQSSISHTLSTLEKLHDGAVLEFEQRARTDCKDMIIVNLLDGSERTLHVNETHSDGRVTVSVTVPSGYVDVDLVPEEDTGRRWRVEYGPDRKGLPT